MSKLENLVKNKIRIAINTTMIENTRPDWLISSQGERLELDIYLPELDLAIEVQGRQHYVFTPHFHNDHNGFSGQLRRDREKRDICARNGVCLLEIASHAELYNLTRKIQSIHIQRETKEDLRSKTHKNMIKKLSRLVTLTNTLEERIEIARNRLEKFGDSEKTEKIKIKLHRMEEAREGVENSYNKLIDEISD